MSETLERGMYGTRELVRLIPATAGSNNITGGRGGVEREPRMLSEGEEGRIGRAAAGFFSPSSSVRFLASVKSLHAINASSFSAFLRLGGLPSLPSSPSPPPLSCPRQHSRPRHAVRSAAAAASLARSWCGGFSRARSRTEEKFDGWFLHQTTPQLRV